MKKKIAILFTIIAIILIIAGIWLWHMSRNLIVIDNKSGKPIASVTIKICGRNYVVKNLPVRESRSLAFDVTSDSGFQVDVFFADSSKQSGNFGYVTTGAGAYNNKVMIEVNSKHIDFKQE